MSNVRLRAALGPLQSLFEVGTASGLTDGQLLERFDSRRGAMAEAAFEALVERHGAMVLGVCRRILSDPHDADDAFQATFLILVQRAGSVRVDDSLGRWLHGVSYRVAVRARARAARRRRFEEGAAATSIASSPNDLARLDLRTVLDEELNRLPEKYRAPVVLCHLQGLSQDETARALGWPLGTVQGRLARARETLRVRLTRRGMAPPARFSIGGLFSQFPLVTVPHALRQSTVQAVVRRVAGEATLAGFGSASAIALAEGVAGTMALTKLKVASLFVLLGIIGAGTTVLQRPATAEQRTSSGRVPIPRASEPDRGSAEPKGQLPVAERKARLRVTQHVDSERVAKGNQVRIRIVVENPGDGAVRQASVRAKLSPGLRAINGPWGDEASFELQLGDLEPRQRVHLDPLVLDTTEAGEQSCEVKVTSPDVAPGAEQATSTQVVTVVEPKLTVNLVGPKRCYTDTIATYSLTVENSGTATDQKVRVQAILPVSGRLVQLPPNSKFDSNTRRITWDTFQLNRGENEKIKLTFEVRMGGPCLYQVTAQAVGEQGLTAKEMTATEVIALAVLDLQITADRRVIDVDQVTTFTIKVANTGSKAATQMILRGKHSSNVVVKKSAGTDEPLRYKQAGGGKPVDGEFVFPMIPRLDPGKEVTLGLQVQALKPGSATCRVFLTHDDGDQPLEDIAVFKVSGP